ncbi:relaxase/mobilization nuclease domain-containing protein [Stenomitos frigidus]|uniref:MobA/VirD2-like nuclease domain-containing protein n=1 Tax=Stenomitos frigidus ULC18 TaxID=2107698 RepID=A0A2T1EMK2_9CYAN|nr:relaxase/mobilization nuclease domain-containing protein [Stenomitos frigidus]PSB33908.1 hypothetical protein C7B82_03320 [Stenomitos frigidus ULC18]
MTIAKIHQNSSARATLGYVLTKPGASVIGGNAADWVERDALTEAQRDALLEDTIALFDLAAALNPIKQPVYHIALSLPPHETLDDEAFSELSDQYLAGLILSAVQPALLKQSNDIQLAAAIECFRQEELPKYFYVIVRHTDAPHPHVHLVVAKINLETTKAIPTSFDRYRSQIVLRSLERQHGLSVQANSWEVDRKAESTQQAQAEIKTGQPSVHKRLQAVLDAAAARSQTVPAFIEQAQARGVEVQMQFTRTGKSKGISYSLDGVAFSGHALGTRYSFKEGDPGLVRHLGLSYAPERDRVLIQTLCRRPVASATPPQIDSPDSTQRLAMEHQRLRALALQQQAEAAADEDERQAKTDSFVPLASQLESSPIAPTEPAPISPPWVGRSDSALEPLPVVAEALQPPLSLPTTVVLETAATATQAPPVLSQPLPPGLPPAPPTPTVPPAHASQPDIPLPPAARRLASVPPPPHHQPQMTLTPTDNPDPSVPVAAEPAPLERAAWGRDIVAVIKLALFVAQQTKHEGTRYRFADDGQTLRLEAMDGRGLLVQLQGERLWVSPQLTAADHQYFQAQRAPLAALQKQGPTRVKPTVDKRKKGQEGR